MISSKLSKTFISIFIVLFLYLPHNALAQSNWNWKDPVDLGVVDLGDNKVLLYNGIALGLVHLLSKKNHQITTSEKFNSLHFEYYHKYRKEPLSTVYSFKYRTGWQWKKAIWLGYELGIFGINDNDFKTGLGLSPFFSWNLINSQKWRLSYSNGVGPAYYIRAFPEGGTKFNFYTFYGIQIENKSPNISYNLGLRNTHISNAALAGNDKNPGFDGIGINLSIRY